MLIGVPESLVLHITREGRRASGDRARLRLPRRGAPRAAQPIRGRSKIRSLAGETMRAVYVDRSPEMREVIERRGLAIPTSICINDGNPSAPDLIRLDRNSDVLIVERTLVAPTVLDQCPSVRFLI